MNHHGTTPTARDADTVMQAFREPLRRFIAKRVASSSDVDDLVQIVLLRIAERRESLDEVEHMSGWLHRIARNAVVDHHRRTGRAESELDAESFTVDAPVASTDNRRDLAACIAPIVARLADPYREALVLTELEGLTQAEAATRVGMSLSGMKSRVQRGREQLRDLVLACCDVELDRRQGITHFASKPGGCGCQSR